MWCDLLLSESVVVGHLALTFGFSLEYYGRDAFIDDFFIGAPFRDRGLGARVLELAEGEAMALGVRVLHLEVERAARAALAIYRKRGF